MLRTPSIFGPLNSGFVPLTPAANVDAAAVEQEASEVIARAAAPAAESALLAPTAPWLPASSARIRIVEGLVVGAICGYFAIGLLRTFIGL